MLTFPTLSYLATAYDTSHPVQLTPSSSDIRAKRDADTLIPANFVSITFLLIKFDLRVYLVPVQVIPVGPSKGAVVLLSIEPPTVKSLKHRLRLRMPFKSRGSHEREQKRTHQTFRPRLTTYSIYFTDLVQGYAILAKKTAMCDEISLDTFR